MQYLSMIFFVISFSCAPSLILRPESTEHPYMYKSRYSTWTRGWCNRGSIYVGTTTTDFTSLLPKAGTEVSLSIQYYVCPTLCPAPSPKTDHESWKVPVHLVSLNHTRITCCLKYSLTASKNSNSTHNHLLCCYCMWKNVTIFLSYSTFAHTP